MSKSIGNVVCPFQAAEQLSVDGLRYVLLSHNPFEDGSKRIKINLNFRKNGQNTLVVCTDLLSNFSFW
jgi:methionyl-tRNA synthetase